MPARNRFLNPDARIPKVLGHDVPEDVCRHTAERRAPDDLVSERTGGIHQHDFIPIHAFNEEPAVDARLQVNKGRRDLGQIKPVFGKGRPVFFVQHLPQRYSDMVDVGLGLALSDYAFQNTHEFPQYGAHKRVFAVIGCKFRLR